MYKAFVKPLLFLLPAERAHHITTTIFKLLLVIPIVGSIARRIYQLEDDRLSVTVMGLKFPNPVGLAAGFDKDGKYYKSMAALGFGFLEIGTVTPLPQDGNAKPRLFRLPKDKALINRMGFNNEGVDAMVSRLAKSGDRSYIIGGNIGKNKITPNEKAIDDYLISFDKLYPYVDYFVVNVSSPNTPGLRSLQDKGPLTALIAAIMEQRATKDSQIPVLLKIAPDLTYEQIDDVLEILSDYNVDGIIATNTTIAREPLITDSSEVETIGNGGLSGYPLHNRSVEVVKYIHKKNPKLTIIGVGGITSPESAQAFLDAGASLVQVYSGMVYEGPALVKRIKKGLRL